jgi:hypothetical protein
LSPTILKMKRTAGRGAYNLTWIRTRVRHDRKNIMMIIYGSSLDLLALFIFI